MLFVQYVQMKTLTDFAICRAELIELIRVN